MTQAHQHDYNMRMTQVLTLLTASQVAARLSVSPETVRRWVREQRLEAIALPSGSLRFRPETVDALLARPVAS